MTETLTFIDVLAQAPPLATFSFQMFPGLNELNSDQVDPSLLNSYFRPLTGVP